MNLSSLFSRIEGRKRESGRGRKIKEKKERGREEEGKKEDWKEKKEWKKDRKKEIKRGKKEKKKTWVLNHRGSYADKASLSWCPLMVSLVLDQDQENVFLVRNRLGPAGMRRPHNHQRFAKIPKWKVLWFLS